MALGLVSDPKVSCKRQFAALIAEEPDARSKILPKKFACLNISQVAGNLAVAATLGDLLAAGVVSHVDLSSVFLANALCSAPFPGNGPNASFAHDLAVLVVKFTWFGTYFDRILV